MSEIIASGERSTVCEACRDSAWLVVGGMCSSCFNEQFAEDFWELVEKFPEFEVLEQMPMAAALSALLREWENFEQRVYGIWDQGVSR